MENMTQGDWQNPDAQSPKKNKFIIITIAALVVVAAVAFVMMQNKKEEVVTDIKIDRKVYTAEEKTQIIQVLSGARVQQAGAVGSLLSADGTPKPAAQVTKERTQILQSLSAAAPKTATILTDAEKLQILNLRR